MQTCTSLRLKRNSGWHYFGHSWLFILAMLFLFCFSREWIERVPPENILRVLICLRMLMRDTTFQVCNFYSHTHFNPWLSYLHNSTRHLRQLGQYGYCQMADFSANLCLKILRNLTFLLRPVRSPDISEIQQSLSVFKTILSAVTIRDRSRHHYM